MSSIMPVSYQATYVPVTPVRPVIYGGARPTAATDSSPGDDAAASAQVSAAKAPGTGTLLDIKV